MMVGEGKSTDQSKLKEKVIEVRAKGGKKRNWNSMERSCDPQMYTEMAEGGTDSDALNRVLEICH